MMIDHASLGTRQFDAAIDFYAHSLRTLGYDLQHRNEREAAFGTAQAWDFWLYPAAADEAINAARLHMAFRAPNREAVMAFHEVALSRGATSAVAPGERPDISPHYYGTVLIDLDGHRIEAVHWRSR